MRWVNESFPPRVRVRWLLAILRLTSSSLAGTGRTLVAVGTARLAAMFLTIAAPAPRIGSPAAGSAAAGVDAAGAEAGVAAAVAGAAATGAAAVAAPFV